MDSRNTVFYSTANTGYVAKAVTSLLSIRNQVPNAKLYLISSGMTDEERALLARYDIEYHEVDYRNKFHTTWQYPIDAYYIFVGPELLLKLGYKYSVYIDGDVYCNADPLLADGFTQMVASAGFAIDYRTIFLEDTAKLEKLWGRKFEDKKRMNTGVVYFNNKKMQEVGFLSVAVDAYEKCFKNDIPRKGDDSLFALLTYLYIPQDKIRYLPVEYNATTHNDTDESAKSDDIVFIHFTGQKPWNYTQIEKSSLRNSMAKKWQALYDESIKTYIDTPVLTFSQKAMRKTHRLYRDYQLWRRGLKKSIITRKQNVKKDPLKLYWWHDYASGITNFGDEITKDLLLSVFGRRAEWSDPAQAELIGAGSIIEIVSGRQNDNVLDVWGSGFIKAPEETVDLHDLNFHAVRGHNTLDRIETQNDVALGDPGLLASIVYPAARVKIQKVGVVVHYIDLDLEIVDAIKRDPRFIVINPLNSPTEVARQISACSLVLSSSLHGLIFADSFEIPSYHIVLSDRVTGGTYKFEDYYSGTGREYNPADVQSIFDSKYLAELIESYSPINNLSNRQNQLIKSFPY